MKPRGIVWQEVTRLGNTAGYICKHCAAELGSNPQILKEHMLADAYILPIEL